MSERSIKTWLEDYASGKFDCYDCETQYEAGWHDWHCRDSSLAGKTKKLAPKVKQIAKSPKVDANSTYVFFKNNFPLSGKLYDDFRICDLETSEVIFTVVPSSGFKSKEGRAEVWGKENDFQEPLVTGTWEDVLKFFEV
jgi:hypothetical protein